MIQPAFATTADQAIAAERHLSTRAAAAVLAADYPQSLAWDIVARSVERQARLAGIRDVDLGRHSLIARGAA